MGSEYSEKELAGAITNLQTGYSIAKSEELMGLAKKFIEACKNIGGLPKVDSYSKKSVELTCYLDKDLQELEYWAGKVKISTDTGEGAFYSPLDLEIILEGNIDTTFVRYNSSLKDFDLVGQKHVNKIKLKIFPNIAELYID